MPLEEMTSFELITFLLVYSPLIIIGLGFLGFIAYLFVEVSEL